MSVMRRLESFVLKGDRVVTLAFVYGLKADSALTGIDESVWWLDPASSLVVEQKNCTDYAHALAGQAQFLVDGSSSASKAGFGGFLRDEVGNIRIMFSGPTENCGAEYAELMAIVTALEVFVEAGWPNNIGLSILSDSHVIIRWISDISLRPWRWWKTFRKLDDLISMIGSVQISYIPRSENKMADLLAREGASRVNLFKAWW
ncbi:hypothetical protein V6N11_025412 [Hibiscus sabdariffa]|uniref:Uncharacterized protein n=2 Tax=Hibiscus sabdariffa TaxID=183260 RepID=A0ABR1ZFC5_9ROSI